MIDESVSMEDAAAATVAALDSPSGIYNLVDDVPAPAGSVPFMRAKQVAQAGVRALQHGGEHLAKSLERSLFLCRKRIEKRIVRQEG